MRLDGTTHLRRAVKMKIGHLSAVDMPAHEGAQALILKAKMHKSAFSEAIAGKEVSDLLGGSWELEQALRDAATAIGSDETITDKPAALREAVEEYIATLTEKLTTPKEADMADTQAELAKYKALSELSDVQKAHYATLQGDEAEQFLKMASDERDEVVAITKQADEQHTTVDGAVISKAKVGDELFDMLKSQDVKLAKMQDEMLNDKFQKRASDELAHLPGTVVEKGAMLRAVATLAAPVADTLTKMLKAADAAAKPGFTPAGAAHTGEELNADDKLEKLAADYAASNKVSKSAAYKAVLATDEGKKLYKESN